MDLKLLMNFPKIKKVTTDFSEYQKIMIEFVKNSASDKVNFELDCSNLKIRKKGVVQIQDKEKDSEDESKKVQKQRDKQEMQAKRAELLNMLN